MKIAIFLRGTASTAWSFSLVLGSAETLIGVETIVVPDCHRNMTNHVKRRIKSRTTTFSTIATLRLQLAIEGTTPAFELAGETGREENR